MHAWPKTRSRFGRIYGYCCTSQCRILVRCGSCPRSKDRESARILVFHVLVVSTCVSLWICLSHYQRKGQRITTYRRHSLGVIDSFQLKSPAYHIFTKSLSFPLIIFFPVTLQHIVIFERESKRTQRNGFAGSSGKGLQTEANLYVHCNLSKRTS
jgi:hypothetical protein